MNFYTSVRWKFRSFHWAWGLISFLIWLQDVWNGPKLFPTDPTSLLSQEPEASMRRPTWLSHFLNKIQWPEIKFPVFMPQPHLYYLNNIPNPFFLVLFPPSLLVALVEVKRPLLGSVSLSSTLYALFFLLKSQVLVLSFSKSLSSKCTMEIIVHVSQGCWLRKCMRTVPGP